MRRTGILCGKKRRGPVIMGEKAGILSMGDSMKTRKVLTYVLFLAIPLAVGGLASLIAYHGMPTYQQLTKPPFTPPEAAFPVVWTILYLLMGVGGARVWCSGHPARRQAILPFGAQLAANFFWTVWFFGAGWYLFAFLWLILLLWLILWMMHAFARCDRLAARLQIPYLVWTGFAAVLTFAVWLLNR